MAEQPPHLEILSRNRVNRSTIVVAVIPVTIFSLVLVYALWSFLRLIAYGVLALLSIGFLYIVALLAIDIRRRWIAAHVIHLGEHGVIDATNWRMLPLALPPVKVTEEKPVIDRSQEEADILELHAHGSGFKSIAQAYK